MAITFPCCFVCSFIFRRERHLPDPSKLHPDAPQRKSRRPSRPYCPCADHNGVYLPLRCGTWHRDICPWYWVIVILSMVTQATPHLFTTPWHLQDLRLGISILVYQERESKVGVTAEVLERLSQLNLLRRELRSQAWPLSAMTILACPFAAVCNQYILFELWSWWLLLSRCYDGHLSSQSTGFKSGRARFES